MQPKTLEQIEESAQIELLVQIVGRIPLALIIGKAEHATDGSQVRVLYVNQTAVEAGLAPEACSGKTLGEGLPHLVEAGLADLCVEAVGSGEARQLPGMQFGGERLKPFAVKVVPLSNNCLYLVFEDINEKHRTAKALEEARLELLRSNRDLEQFAYVASHDLQEPLRKIASFTGLLAKRYQGHLDKDADEFIEFIVDGTKRMQDLINDLLNYARLSTRPAKWDEFESAELLNEVLADLDERVKGTKAVVTHGQLPRVKAIKSQFRQLFQNLLSNAMKFQSEDDPRIEVSARREGKAWRFEVADNGRGIKPEYFEKVFVIFQRLQSRAAAPGTGLGLALCKKIVEKHGGKIWVETAAKQGSKFIFTLPIEEESA